LSNNKHRTVTMLFFEVLVGVLCCVMEVVFVCHKHDVYAINMLGIIRQLTSESGNMNVCPWRHEISHCRSTSLFSGQF